MHGVEVVDESLHRLAGVLARVFKCLRDARRKLLFGHLGAEFRKGRRELFERRLFGLYGIESGERRFFDLFGVRKLRPRERAAERHAVAYVLDERLPHARGEKEVEGRNRLAAVLLVLVCLENYRRERRVALYGLRGAYAAVFGVESAPENVFQVVLYAGRGLGGVVVEVVDVDVSVAVGARVLYAYEVFEGVVLRHFRSERHHLSGGSVRRHVGVAEVDVVFLYGRSIPSRTVFIEVRLSPLGIPPLAVENVFLGNVRV